MKIVTWSELDRKEEIVPVFMLAFGSPFTLRGIEEMIRTDPRLNRSAIGLCAMENDHLVGFVGVMELTTKNVDGAVEPAGGIWGVATLPSHANSGVSTALMNEVHQHFREKRYRFSFLMTRRTIIAYHLYLKLGYGDVTEFPSAYKILRKRRASRKRARDTKTDWGKIFDIYSGYTADKTGFVVRDIDYFQTLQKRASIDYECKERVAVGDKGYAFFGEAGRTLHVDELVPTDENISDDLIREIESQAKDFIYDRMVLNEKVLASYRLRRFLTHDKSHGLLMAKALTGETTFKETYADKFFMTLLDSF
jgi:ribosomal protein S18 acetylase RimI-like enzyme